MRIKHTLYRLIRIIIIKIYNIHQNNHQNKVSQY
jgi:hypothetical protein